MEATLFEGFAVCGLASPLTSLFGEDFGFKGLDACRFKPALLDQLLLDGRKLPLQLPTCCMPDGVEVVPAAKASARLKSADLAPKLYSLVLTDEGGRRLYVSCLSYRDAVPTALACRHEQLVGSQATRTLCLVSRLPYLKAAEQVLRRLYIAVFFLGPSAPLGDLVTAVLRLPSPAALQRELRFQLEGRSFELLPPDETGAPRGGEVTLQALLAALSPVNVLLTFLAVLLERRVVVVSGQLRLPTLAAEGLMKLLWPIRYQHVYVPLVPSTLLDLLDAPTPFLMGVGGAAGEGLAAELAGVGSVAPAGGGGGGGGLAAQMHEGLVVADLDRDWVYNCADLRPCLEHPAAVQLLACLSALRQQAATDAGGLAEEEDLVARGMGSKSASWTAGAVLAFVRIHMSEAVGPKERAASLPVDPKVGSGGGAAAAAPPDPWMPYVRKAASTGWSPGHDALVRRLFLRLFSSLLRGYHEHLPPSASSNATAGADAGRNPAGGRAEPPQGFSPSAPLFTTEPFLQSHGAAHGPKARLLAAQLIQTQGFYVLLDEYGSSDPYGWYTKACTACRYELSLANLGPTGQNSDSPPTPGEGEGELPAEEGGGAPHRTAAVAPAPIIVIGVPVNEEATAAMPASSPCLQHVYYTRPCPLLQRRKAPPYRTFPALHISDQNFSEAGAASAAASAALQGWQWHVMDPGATAAAATGSCSSDNGNGGGARGGGGPGGKGAAAEGDGAVPARKRPAANRRNRSLSGSISGDLAAALAAEFSKPRFRASACDVSSAGSVSSASSFLAPTTANTTSAGAAPSPASDLPHCGKAANDAAAVAPAAPPAFTANMGSSPGLRAARRATASVSACPVPGGPGALAGAGACAAAAAGGGAGHKGGGGCNVHLSLAHYAVEQELVRQQIGALSQLLGWGEQPARQQQTQGGGGGVAAGAAAGAAASEPGSPYVPEEAEVERIRALLSLQAGGNGAFLVGRLREEVTSGGSGAVAPAAAGPTSTPSPATATGSGIPAALDTGGRCLHQAAYSVLVDAFDALVTAAVQHQDFGVLAATLELAMSLCTHTGPGPKVRLMHAMSCNPYLYTRFVWGGIFCHKLLTLAVAAAAGSGTAGGDDVTAGFGASVDDEGNTCATLSPAEALRRQRALLRGLQRSLCAQATWLMHLGVAEEPAWELLAGLVFTAGVGDLRIAREGDHLHHVLLSARAAMRCAKTDAFQQHRQHVLDADCFRPGQWPPSQLLPQHQHRQPGRVRISLSSSLDVSALPASKPLGVASPPPGPVPPRSPGFPRLGNPAAATRGSASTSTLSNGLACSSDNLAGKRVRDGGSLEVDGAVPASPQCTGAAAGKGVIAGGGSGGGNGRAYSVQYERLLAIAASSGRLTRTSGNGSKACQQQQGQQDQQQNGSAAGLRRPRMGAAEGRPASAVALGAGRPVVALAAASGVVLAAVQEPSCHILSCQQEGCLRVASKLLLTHLDAAFADMLAITADGATAAMSTAPAPLPPPASATAVTGAAAAAGFRPAARSRMLAMVDVSVGRIVRELRPASRSRITALVLSPTVNLLATGCAASWAQLWDVRPSSARSSPVVSLQTRQGGVSALLLDSARLRLYTGGRDGTAAEWDLRKPSCPVVVCSGHSGWVTAMELLPQDAPAAVAAVSRPDRLTRSVDSLAALKTDPAPQHLVTASDDWTVRLWSPQESASQLVGTSGAAPARHTGGEAPLGLRLSDAVCSWATRGGGGGGGDGSKAAFLCPEIGGGGCSPGSTTGGPCAAVRGDAAVASSHVYSDGTTCNNGATAMAGLRCIRPQAVLVGHGAAITALYVEKDAGNAGAIYTGAQDGTVGIWSADGRCRQLLPCHGGAVTMVMPRKPRRTADRTTQESAGIAAIEHLTA